MILTSHVTHTLVIWGKMMQNIHIWLKHFMLKRSRSRSLTKLRREMRYVLTHRWVSAFSCTEGIHNVSAIVDKLFVVWACWPLRVFIETQMMILLMLIFPLQFLLQLIWWLWCKQERNLGNSYSCFHSTDCDESNKSLHHFYTTRSHLKLFIHDRNI